VAATSKPVTLKMRLGWNDDALNAPDIARRAEAAGVQMIVVHGRTRCQFFRGAANWAAIRPTVEAVGIPVIANGDIGTVDDARRALQESGAAGVMIGRAAQGRPWLVSAIIAGLRNGHAAQVPSLAEIHASLDALYRDSLAFYGVDLGVRIARKHISWAIDAEATYLNPEARRAARAEVCRMMSPDDVCAALARIFVDADWREAA